MKPTYHITAKTITGGLIQIESPTRLNLWSAMETTRNLRAQKRGIKTRIVEKIGRKERIMEDC